MPRLIPGMMPGSRLLCGSMALADRCQPYLNGVRDNDAPPEDHSASCALGPGEVEREGKKGKNIPTRKRVPCKKLKMRGNRNERNHERRVVLRQLTLFRRLGKRSRKMEVKRRV